VAPHVAHQFDSYLQYLVQGTGQPVPRATDPDRLLSRRLWRSPLGYFLLGTPEDAADRIREATKGAPVDTVFFWASVGGMGEEMVAAHVRTICTELVPRLADSHPAGATR
jgi:alkanesulfonate monooxygenase SsuD/methylene tetrahydromethanopterin reductase-like flavin-dependent oxidoreductase (luciferase family)